MATLSNADIEMLVRRVRTHDAVAFERLFRALHAPLCEVVDSLVRSQDIAEEIVQELFFTVWINAKQLDIESSARAYLFTAARNRALAHLRHRSVIRRWTERAMRDESVNRTVSGPTPIDDSLEIDERTRLLRGAIDRLPVRCRTALILRLDHEMSQADIAQAMGVTIKAVEKLLASAKVRLRELVGSAADDAADTRG
ncbi:MAG TPA: sigma-70 family RNA polymerase sigma factor [Gemmatimonadaceae bacterium]|nr:sigma-70 family RNA polymerase sigma factor [Gemmatimonadaceae bacterium]